MAVKRVKKSVVTQKQKELIERTGVFFERQGFSPAVARISSLMLVSDKLELTFEEIYETLNLSKSSASNAINFLLHTNKIEYMTKPGDRKRYFRAPLKGWETMLKERFQGFSPYVSYLQEIYDQRTKETKAFNADLKEVIEFIAFMSKELPSLFEKWQKSKK
jgi:DNA-binding transcriptional regulator GbsR (MarR family)